MKSFFKKINKGQDVEQDDLNLDYGDFYSGKDSRGSERVAEEPRRETPATEHSAGGYYDVPKTTRGGYEEPDFQSENTRFYDAPQERPAAERPAPERPVMERPVAHGESFVKPRETWQEGDAPGFRAPQPEAEAPAAPAVFTPSPAPAEFLYFTPSTYRDCREGIVKGLATGHVVVIRLRNLEAGDVLRLFDYMMGAVLALEGQLVRPAATTVVLIPKDVEINEDDLEPEDEEEDEEEEEEEYAEEDDEYVEDTYENGEYGAYDDEDDEDDGDDEDAEEYEDEEYEDEEYEDEEYEDEEYEDEEYEDEEYEDEEYEDEEYEDEEYEDEEYEDEEYEDEEYEDEYEDEDGEYQKTNV